MKIAEQIEQKWPEMQAIIKDLRIANTCAFSITGSFALWANDIKIRRFPSDLDIYVPYHNNVLGQFKMPEGSIKIDLEDDYPEEGYDRNKYLYNGMNIDILEAHSTEYNLRLAYRKYISTVHPSEIIKFKWKFMMENENESKVKHYLDIQYMMENNWLDAVERDSVQGIKEGRF